MKKIYLLALFFISLIITGCNWNTEKGLEQTGNVTISFGSVDRKISPADWNIADISSWNISITGKENITETVSTSSKTYSLPAGDYSVTVTGTTDKYTITGKENFSVEENKKTSVLVKVGLKKEGKGSFRYELTADKANVEAFLISATDNTEIELDITVNPNGNYIVYSLSKSDIYAGDYVLVVLLDGNPVKLTDNIIEIIGGLETTGSCENVEFEKNAVNFYVSNNKEDSYSGISPEYKIEVNQALKWLQENDNWTEANLYYSSNANNILDDNEIEMYDNINTCPIIDIDYLSITKDNYKRINVYTDGVNIYSIINGEVCIVSGYYNGAASSYNSIPNYFAAFSSDTVGKSFTINCIQTDLSNFNLYLDKASAIVRLDHNQYYTLITTEDNFNSYFSQGIPLIIDRQEDSYGIIQDNDNVIGLYGSNLSLVVIDENGEPIISGKYELSEKIVDKKNCHFAERYTFMPFYSGAYLWYVAKEKYDTYIGSTSELDDDNKYAENFLDFTLDNKGNLYVVKSNNYSCSIQRYTNIKNERLS